MLIDTHCHIDRFPDPMALASECEAKEIMTIAVTNIPSHYEMAAEHIGSMRYIKPALGFHPLAAADNMVELPLFLSLLGRAEFVGEIGLDYSKEGIRSKDEQMEVFRAIAKALSKSARFVTLHSLLAAEDVLAVLEEFDVSNAVFHWYSGTTSTLQRAVDAGHFFSINTAMLVSKTGRSVLEKVPHDRILTETDGPYVKIENKAAKPADVKRVLEGIACMWEVPVDEVEAQIASNFKELCAVFGIRIEDAHS